MFGLIRLLLRPRQKNRLQFKAHKYSNSFSVSSYDRRKRLRQKDFIKVVVLLFSFVFCVGLIGSRLCNAYRN